MDKQSHIEKLFAGIPLSEPLVVFKSNVETVLRLIEEKEESRQSAESLIDLLKKAGAGESQAVYVEPETRESLLRSLPERLQSYQNQLETLMPMSFVYMVAVWDAFILDTARRILRVHPQLISESTDNFEVSKTILWNINSAEAIRDFLIESEVRRLDFKRLRIARSFKEYWGIDWERSKVPLNKVFEIRARRDIWVHNRGVINQQYAAMVGGSALEQLGQQAEITSQYLLISLTILIRLATYIHKLAYEKHYSKAEK